MRCYFLKYLASWLVVFHVIIMVVNLIININIHYIAKQVCQVSNHTEENSEYH